MRLAEELKLERALDELCIALDAAAHYSMETPAPEATPLKRDIAA